MKVLSGSGCPTLPPYPKQHQHINHDQQGGWHNVLQEIHLNLNILGILHLDGNRTILSCDGQWVGAEMVLIYIQTL